MSDSIAEHIPTTNNDVPALDNAIKELMSGANELASMPVGKLRDLIDACIEPTASVAIQWVELACQAKRIALDSPLAAEEILAGPASLLRYLHLLSSTLRDIENSGQPKLPGKLRKNLIGRTCVPVLPVANLYDNMLFMGLKAEVWMQPGVDEHSVFSSNLPTTTNTNAQITGVLGAGNVSTIPITDALYKIFHEREAVLLKLNPVNEYLEPIFTQAFRPLIEANLLRIVRGDNKLGEAIVHHSQIDTLHLTGSHLTHDAIVWGTDADKQAIRKQENQPLVTKPVTSELGNVTPWIVVPGNYSKKQLRSQAGHLAASIANNASFNCVATKMIVTARDWPQREEFLDLLDSILKTIPPRFAYYPCAAERFERATGQPNVTTNNGCLPWTLIRNANPDESPHLFKEESFVCVCAETSLDQSEPMAFVEQAIEFVNDRLFGTLSATLTLPKGFPGSEKQRLESAIARLRYGSVCINQWSGIVFGLMTPPWGGAVGSTLANPQSGIGCVHNTFFADQFDKTVLVGPLCSPLKPVWFASHRTAHKVAWNLVDFNRRPSLAKLIPITFNALRG